VTKIPSKKIANATTDLRVFYTTEFDKGESGLTNNDGIATFEIEIDPASTPGNFDVTATVKAAGYDTETDRTTFEVIEEPDDTNETSSQNNTTNNNNDTDTNNSQEGANGNTNQNEDAEIEPSSDQEQQQSEEEDQNDTGNGNNEGDVGEDGSSDNNNNSDDDGSSN